MKKLQIKLEYQDKTYSSQIAEVSEEEIVEIKNFLEKVTKGSMSYLTFENEGTHYHFPKNIIENSIISLVIT